MPLDDDQWSDLLDRQTSVHEVQSHPGYRALIDRLTVDIGKKQETMNMGLCRSWEEYQAVANWLECAMFVLRLPEVIDAEVGAERQNRADYKEQQ